MTALKHFTVKSHLTALDKALALPVRQAAALQPEQMEHILRILAGRRHHEPFSFAFALAFTTFVRQSNLAPQSESSFNPARHTQRKDMVQSKDGLFLAVFWTKTRQHSRTPDLIPLPLLKDSILCPVFHWIKYKDYSRGAPMQGPLLVTTAQAGAQAVSTTITLPFLRSVFANLVQEAGLTGQFTLHSLRRGGSQTCYREGAAISDVMLQGTWTSGAVWDYLAKGISHNSSVIGAWERVAARLQTDSDTVKGPLKSGIVGNTQPWAGTTLTTQAEEKTRLLHRLHAGVTGRWLFQQLRSLSRVPRGFPGWHSTVITQPVGASSATTCSADNQVNDGENPWHDASPHQASASRGSLCTHSSRQLSGIRGADRSRPSLGRPGVVDLGHSDIQLAAAQD